MASLLAYVKKEYAAKMNIIFELAKQKRNFFRVPLNKEYISILMSR